MRDDPKKLSRREFFLKTALCAAGSLWLTNPFFRPLAHAFAAGNKNNPPKHLHKRGKIAIIIDDVGFNRSRVEPFIHLGFPITFSILPQLRYSRVLAEKIHDAGHEIMLHQPMEPHNHMIDPGPGALYLSQKTDQVCRIIEKNVASFPHAAGFNNHMGSRFTESRPKMSETLEFFREREFFFIDSITSSQSIAFDTARDMNVIAGFRNEFLDNTWEKKYIYAQLLKLKRHALHHGHAVGIGHPRPSTVRALTQFLQDMKGSGFSIVYASQIVYA